MNQFSRKRSRHGRRFTEQQVERLLLDIAPDVRLRLAEHCAATGQTERAVLQLAIERHLELMQRIDRLESSAERTRHRLEDLFGAFARFMERWRLTSSRSPNDRSN